MKAVWVLVGWAALLPACGDEGITGFWNGDLADPPGASVTFSIEESDETVMGVADLTNGSHVQQSEVQGSVENEWVELQFPGFEGAVHYEAGLQGDDKMTGTWTARGVGQKLTLKRVR